jgi:hypothetical protein
VATCADLRRGHIEQYKAWVTTKPGRYTGKPLNRIGTTPAASNANWGYLSPDEYEAAWHTPTRPARNSYRHAYAG